MVERVVPQDDLAQDIIIPQGETGNGQSWDRDAEKDGSANANRGSARTPGTKGWSRIKDTIRSAPGDDERRNFGIRLFAISLFANVTSHSSKRDKVLQETLGRSRMSIRHVASTVSDQIVAGDWDEFDDTNFEPPNEIDFLLLQFLGAAPFVVVLFVFALPFTDCPANTDIIRKSNSIDNPLGQSSTNSPQAQSSTNSEQSSTISPANQTDGVGHFSEKTPWDRFLYCFMVGTLGINLFPIIMQSDPHAYTWDNFVWYLKRTVIPCILFRWIVLEIIASAKESSFNTDYNTSTKEVILLCVLGLGFGGAMTPLLESVARVMAIREWRDLRSLIRMMLQTPRESVGDSRGNAGVQLSEPGSEPQLKGKERRQMVRCAFYCGLFVASCAGGIGWVIVDIVFLRKKEEFAWQIVRPGALLIVKRCMYLTGIMAYQVSGFLLPQARHYGPSVIFSYCGFLNAVYLGATPGWTGFGLFMCTNWIAHIVRVWAFSSYHGTSYPFLRQIRESLSWSRMISVGTQDPLVLHGWFVLCEGVWQTIGYLTILLLYPLSLWLDANHPTVFRSETTGEVIAVEKSVLHFGFYPSATSRTFIILAALNDYVQDRMFHWYCVKKTTCHFTRHLGKRNWPIGNLSFISLFVVGYMRMRCGQLLLA